MSRFLTNTPNAKRMFGASLISFAMLMAPLASLGSTVAAKTASSPAQVGLSQHSKTEEKGKAEFKAGAAMRNLSPNVLASITFLVNSVGDDSDAGINGICDTDTLMAGNQCTLRAAIQEANSNPGDDFIDFSLPPNSIITLTAEPEPISDDLTIDGPNSGVTVSGDDYYQVFNVVSGTVSILDLTIINGAAFEGGGISSFGNLTIRNSTFTGNYAIIEGGAIYSDAGTLNIINSTISGNFSEGEGGGLLNCGTSTANLASVTITNNYAAIGESSDVLSGAGVPKPKNPTESLLSEGFGGGIGQVSSNPITLLNTIVAGNFAGDIDSETPDDIFVELDSPIDTANSFNNLIGDENTAGGFTDGPNENQVGVDPLLGPLGSNGGPTQTHHLMTNSPAIDKGKNFVTNEEGSPVFRDQRGLTRPVDLDDSPYPNTAAGDGSDIGAYELQGDTTQTDATLIVNTAADHDDGFCTDGDCTLREAVNAANLAPGSTITFDIPGPGPHLILLSDYLDFLAVDMNIQGPTNESVEVSGDGYYQVFTIFDPMGPGPCPGCPGPFFPVVNISNLIISNGFDLVGGGIVNTGELTVDNCTFTGNGAFGGGGAIANYTQAIIRNSTFTNNEAGFGGAVYGVGESTIENSTFTGNHAFDEGGAIDTEDGTLLIVNSTISGNSSDGDGGGLLHCDISTGTLINVTITNNRADALGEYGGLGGGIGQVSSNLLKLSNTIVAGNVVGPDPSTTPDDIFVAPAGDFPASEIDLANSFNNLIGDANTSGGITHNTFGNIVGNAGMGTIDINTVLNTTLASNGGPTQTHALVPNSVALDKGLNSEASTAGLLTDQRGTGFPRVVDGDGDATATVDIGAFELLPNLGPTVVSIDDGDADNVVPINSTLTYTITFDKDIAFTEAADISDLSAADFDNAGTATITIGTILEPSPGVFTIQVTPTTAGTIILRIPAGATINDVDGNPLGTPVSDDDTVTVDTPPTLGNYPATTVSFGQSTAVTPDAPPADDVPGLTVQASISSGFSGSVSVNPTTGVVTINNPVGPVSGTPYTVTVTANDGINPPVTRQFLLTVQAGTPCTGATAFSNKPDVSAGSGPFSVAIGDFNNDGKQDLATANFNSSNVSIRLGDGLGGFSGTTEVSVGASPRSVAIGNFNNDANLDLAVGTGESVSIRLGDGLGGFSGTTEVGAPEVFSVAIGEFNNDGNQDLAIATPSSTVAIRLGDGLGGFSGTTQVSVANGPVSIALADFDNDGRQDFASASFTQNLVSIRLGDGLGDFGGTTNVGVGTPNSIAIADFNNDGNPDFATTNGTNAASIRLGDGLGGFSNAPDVSVGPEPRAVAIGDFNNDGNSDLATANASPATVSVRIGNGLGGFSGATNVSVGSFPVSIAIGDFNIDGSQDFATANQGAGTDSIRLGFCGSAPVITSANNTTFTVGTAGSFTVTATGSPQPTLSMTGTLPAGVTFTPGTGQLSGTPGPASNGTYNLIFTATNSAGQTSQNFTLTVIAPANISGTKTKAGGNTPGQTVTYTVVLSNSSSSAQLDNPGNEFTDTLPAGLTLVSATATSGTAAANVGTNTVNWNGSIAGNGSVTITIMATINNVPDGTIISNQGTISYDADGNGTNEASRLTDDPAVGGASDPTSFAVNSKSDLTITKTHSGNFSGGQMGASYTITVNNVGTGVTSGQVTVTDTVPVGLTPTGPNGVVNGWTCAINGQTLTCTRSDVLSGGSSYPPINLTVNVANPAPLNVVNTATVSGGGDVNTANNTASDPTAINCSANFALNNTSPLMISRFRENGPAGPQDEFVEIYNPSPLPHTVASGNCNGGGYGVYASAGNGTTADTATLVCYIPNGTVIPAGGYYLCTGVTYSLNNLGLNGGAAGATATGDAPIGCGGTCGTNIPNDAGLVLINKAAPTVTTPEGFGAVEFGQVIYDKVGFGPYGPAAPAPGYPSLSSSYCEGGAVGCLKPVGDASTGAACTNPTGQFPVVSSPPACYGLAGQYEFLRRQTTFSASDGTIHQDTNNNGNDFILVAPNPATNMGQTITGVAGVTAVLGAAGPYNRQAPPDMPAVKLTRSPFDGTDQLGPRNLERRFIPDPTIADLANNPLGTLILRVKFTNNSGLPINGIRFSVDNLSTLCGPQVAAPTLASVATGDARNLSSTPGCGTGSFTAIFKALNSTSEIMVDSGGTAQFVNGTVMEDLSVGAAPGTGPLSPKGGGIDSTFIINPSSNTATVGDGVTGGVGNFATTIGTTDPTKVLRVSVKFGVVRSGRFILLLVPMAKNSPAP